MELTVNVSKNFSYALHPPPEQTLFDQLCTWLPMPQRRVQRNWQPLQQILGILTGMHLTNGQLLTAPVQTAVSHPYCTLANAIIQLVYRNGLIEESHAGRRAAFPLHRRHFTDRQTRRIVPFTAKRLSPFVSTLPLWDKHLPAMTPWPESVAGLLAFTHYPRLWLFTESSASVQLESAWAE